jgi:hypothetical protein
VESPFRTTPALRATPPSSKEGKFHNRYRSAIDYHSHPKYFWQAWQALDREATTEHARLAGTDHRPAITSVVAAFCLVLIHYLKPGFGAHRAPGGA